MVALKNNLMIFVFISSSQVILIPDLTLYSHSDTIENRLVCCHFPGWCVVISLELHNSRHDPLYLIPDVDVNVSSFISIACSGLVNFTRNLYKETFYKASSCRERCVQTRLHHIKKCCIRILVLKRSINMIASQSSVLGHDKPRPVVRFSYEMTFRLVWDPD